MPTTRAMTIVYQIGTSLYVNLTNRCPCACTFCVRQLGDNGVCDDGADSLWLEHEPDFDEVMAAFAAFETSGADVTGTVGGAGATGHAGSPTAALGDCREVVFCGYGEPTEAFDLLVRVGRAVKQRYGLPVRLNTNGLGSLINGRDIAPELAGTVDTVSISLNAPNAARYQDVTHSRFGETSFDAMLAFAREVRAWVPNVVMTTVSTSITADEERRCQAICDELGVRYRIRTLVE